jgi:hypothetical protein
MVSMLALNTVDYDFKPQTGQTKNCEIGICSLSAEHISLRSKSKDWVAQNKDNVWEWSNMSSSRLLFQ